MGAWDVYIPDLTERFPEGFGGVDLTDSYFPDEGVLEDQFWEQAERDMEE